jgi:hypothetical protein
VLAVVSTVLASVVDLGPDHHEVQLVEAVDRATHAALSVIIDEQFRG